MTGIVKFYKEDRGYGFVISDEDGHDYFIHHTSLDGSIIKSGDRIEFELKEKRNGLQAVNIKKI